MSGRNRIEFYIVPGNYENVPKVVLCRDDFFLTRNGADFEQSDWLISSLPTQHKLSTERGEPQQFLLL